jgi:hypothetical protein
MSRDQKPGKIRLVSGPVPPQPERRANEPKPSVEAPVQNTPKRGPGLLLAILFLIGCAAGGALFTAYLPTGAATA